MGKLVDADMVTAKLREREKALQQDADGGEVHRGRREGLVWAIRFIHAMEGVEPQEQAERRGQWVLTIDHQRWMSWICSLCLEEKGEEDCQRSDTRTRYCPDCGARMNERLAPQSQKGVV